MVREDASADMEGLINARAELEAARQWFEWVTEPPLVDEAIFRLRAAEMRLTHAMAPWRGHRDIVLTTR